MLFYSYIYHSCLINLFTVNKLALFKKWVKIKILLNKINSNNWYSYIT